MPGIQDLSDVELQRQLKLQAIPDGELSKQLEVFKAGSGKPGFVEPTSGVLPYVARGMALGLPGLVGDIAQKSAGFLKRNLLPSDPQEGGAPGANVGPPSPSVSDSLEKLWPTPKLKGAERVVGDVVAGVAGGGLMGRLTKPEQISKMLAERMGAWGGLGSAVGGEASARVLGEEGYARLIGSLIGGAFTGGAALVGGPRGVGQIREALSNVPDSSFAGASRNLENMQAQGTRGLAPQAFDNPVEARPFLQLQERLSQRPGAGPIVTRRLGEQTSEATDLGKGLLGQLAPQQAAGDATLGAQRAAAGAIGSNEAARTAQTSPFYAFNIDQFPKNFVRDNMRDLAANLTRMGPTTKAAEYIKKEVLDRLVTRRGLEQHPEAVGDILNKAIKGIEMRSFTSEPLDDHTAGQIRMLLQPFSESLDRLRVNPVEGKRLYGQISEQAVNPLERGLIGEIAGPKGPQGHAPPPTDKLMGILESKDHRGTEIAQTAYQMNRQDPTAFAGLVRGNLQRKMDDALRGEGGWSDPQAPTRLANAWWGVPGSAQRTNFMASVRGAAEGQMIGARSMQTPASIRIAPRELDRVQAGVTNVMRAIEMSGRGRGGMSGSVAQEGGSNALLGAAAVALPMKYTAARIASGVADATVRKGANIKLAELITAGTPESVEILRQMARRSPMEIAKAISWGATPEIAIQVER